jgi:hypothetical protein
MAVAFAGLAGCRNPGISSRHATDWGRFDGACGVLAGASRHQSRAGPRRDQSGQGGRNLSVANWTTNEEGARY